MEKVGNENAAKEQTGRKPNDPKAVSGLKTECELQQELDFVVEELNNSHWSVECGTERVPQSVPITCDMRESEQMVPHLEGEQAAWRFRGKRKPCGHLPSCRHFFTRMVVIAI